MVFTVLSKAKNLYKVLGFRVDIRFWIPYLGSGKREEN